MWARPEKGLHPGSDPAAKPLDLFAEGSSTRFCISARSAGIARRKVGHVS